MAHRNSFEGNPQDGLHRLETLIRELAAFLPQITALPSSAFYDQLLARVREIDVLSRQYPERRELFKKMCFDLCAYALDQSALLWRIRHKPFGYGGDFETLEMLYTGETHSKGVGKAWDEFVIRGSRALMLQRQHHFAQAFETLCQRRGQHSIPHLSILSISANVRDFLRAIQAAPECARRSLFFCQESEPKAISHYKKMLAEVSKASATFVWDSRDVLTLSFERSFDLIWLPRSLPYLSDESVITLLKKLRTLLRPGSVLLVAAAQSEEGRMLLEWCTGWTLYQRSPEAMRALFLQAGIPERAIHFEDCWWLEQP
jgi:SAM-dependent methyltransferase